MTPTLSMIRGTVRGGVVVPSTPGVLTEGTEVAIVIRPAGIGPEVIEEFAAWERASDEAWEFIEMEERKSHP